MSLTRVPANLITGFLGAGKTTVIRNLLAQRPHGERWAVLVNDFGKAVLDDAVRDSDGGIVVREVAGGCICCTAQVELRTALVRLLREARPQRLLIELSGAGRPSAILNVLREKTIAEAVEQRAGLCVLDPRQFADPALGARDDYLEQMVFADVLVINKSDTAGSGKMARIREAAAKLAGRMAVVTTHGQISAALLDAPAHKV
jgi:G3E family GTPase